MNEKNLAAYSAVELSEGTGRHRIFLRFLRLNGGYVGALFGGTKPHVGGVILAIPRLSLTGQGRSCDLFNVPVPSHLDNEVGAPLARALCASTGLVVSLTSGIHVTDATESDLEVIKKHCNQIMKKLLAIIDES